MKAIHKRAERWKDLPFASLGEAADFITELEPKLEAVGVGQTSVSVTTEERDFRELTLDELRELSKVLPLDAMQSLIVSCGGDEDQGVRLSLFVLNDRRLNTELGVEGEEEVVVDGLFVGAKKGIEGCFEKIQRAEELAEAKSKPHVNKKVSAWDRWEPWLIEVLGGAIATVVGAVVLFLIFN